MSLADRYAITEEIGNNRTTIVCRAQRLEDGLPVVLKIVTATAYAPVYLQQLQREYDLMQRLRLPGVVQPYALERDGQTLALVLEDFGGVSLEQIITTQQLTIEDCLTIALQLANTLAQIHAQGIMHKDLKSGNILLNPHTREVKVIDFGIASPMEQASQPISSDQMLEGTLGYISPEQTGRMNCPVDYRSDFYSLGVTFYELLTGHLPFQASDPIELVHAHIARQPLAPDQRNAAIPAALAAVVMKLLAKTAEERYQSAESLKADLQHCLDQWQTSGTIAPFLPGQRDISDHAHILNGLRSQSQSGNVFEQATASTSSTASTGTRSEVLDLTTVMKAARTLASEIVLDTLLEKIIGIVMENAGAQRGFLVLERNGVLTIEAEGSVDDSRVTVLQAEPVESAQRLPEAILYYVWRLGESLVLADAVQDRRFANDSYIVRERPRSILCVPVVSRGTVIGIVYLENNLAVNAFSELRIELTRMLVSHAAISLENARLYDEMKREVSERKRAEETLRSITEGTAAVTGGDFFRTLLSYITSVFEARYAFVAECIDETKTRARTFANLRDQVFVDDFEYDVRNTPCEFVLAGDVSYYPERLCDFFPHLQSGVESYLGAPLFSAAGEILGHLVVMDDQPMHRTPYDISVLKIFAARAGIELERKQAGEALQQREEELRRLNEQLEDYSRNLEHKVAERAQEIEQRRQVAAGLHDLLTVLNSSRSLTEILAYMVSRAARLLGTESGAIYRLQEDQQVCVPQAHQGIPDEYVENLELSIHNSFLGQAILERQPVIVFDPAGMSARRGLLLTERRRHLLASYQTLLAVPLIRQGESEDLAQIYGGIALYYPEARQFSEEEIELAVAFADQAALAIENASLRQRAKQAAIMEERGRLARELHDSVTQSLYSLTLLAEGWRRMAGSGRLDDMAEPLTELGSIAQQALKEMRLLVHELRPPALEKEGLLGALHERLSSVERRAGVEARLLADEVLELPPAVEEGLYRIAQEALNNALKHAAATTVLVNLRSQNGCLALEITDNGWGFDLAATNERGGIGLHSMRERMEQLGGRLEIASAPGEGTRVEARLELDS